MSGTTSGPRGWSEARLEDLFETITDGDHQAPPQVEEGIPFLVIGNVRTGRLDFTDVRFVAEAYYQSLAEHRKPARGDLLYTVTGSLGIPALVDTDRAFCVQRHIAMLKPTRETNVRYLFHALASAAAFQQATKAATGTAQKTLGLASLRAITVHVAPAEEEVRVVDALESYLSRIDAAVATLEAAQRKVKAYRASVLKAAVAGRLVPTEAALARAEKRDFEPADVLLKRILAERRRRWEEAEVAKLNAASNRPKDDKWRAKYEVPKPLDTAKLPPLPEGWCWASLDQLLTMPLANGKSVPDGDGFPVLRLTCIRNGVVDLSQRKSGAWGTIDPLNFVVKPDDFLVVRGNGSINLVGRGARVPSIADPVAFPDTTIRVAIAGNALVPALLARWWDSPPIRDHLQRRAKTTAGIYKVNQTDLAETPVPLPPYAEQRRIQDEIERVDSVATESDRELGVAAARSVRLRQSILKWAFEGKLVDQDPNDEPAKKLLERIRTERANAETPRRARRTGTAQ